MTPDILNSPVRVNERSRTVYFLDGYVSVEIVSGTEEQQKAVLALVGQAQRMAQVLLSEMVRWEDGLMHDETRCGLLSGGTCPTWCEEKRAVLRDAGVMSDRNVESEGR